MHVPSQGRKKGDDCMLTCIVDSQTHEPRASDSEGENSVKFTAWWREEAAGRQGGQQRPKAHRSSVHAGGGLEGGKFFDFSDNC
jgi:hypothetical protein